MIQDASLVLFIAVYSMVGFSFVHFVVQQLPLLAAFETDFFIFGGVAIVTRAMHL